MGNQSITPRPASARSTQSVEPVPVRRATFSRITLPTPAITVQLDQVGDDRDEWTHQGSAQVETLSAQPTPPASETQPSTVAELKPTETPPNTSSPPATAVENGSTPNPPDRRWDRVVDQDPVLAQISALRQIVRSLKDEVAAIEPLNLPAVRPLSARAGFAGFAVPTRAAHAVSVQGLATHPSPAFSATDESALAHDPWISSHLASRETRDREALSAEIQSPSTAMIDPETSSVSLASPSNGIWSARLRSTDWWMSVAWQGTAAAAIVGLLLLANLWMFGPDDSSPVDESDADQATSSQLPMLIDDSDRSPTARIVGILPADSTRVADNSNYYQGPLTEGLSTFDPRETSDSAEGDSRLNDTQYNVSPDSGSPYSDSPLEYRAASPAGTSGARR